MNLIKNVNALPFGCPPYHYDLQVRTIVAPGVDSKVTRAAFVTMEPTGRADPHTHDNAEHVFIVLKGELGVKTPQGEEISLKSGDAYYVPPGEIHENYNLLAGETQYIVITCRVQP